MSLPRMHQDAWPRNPNPKRQRGANLVGFAFRHLQARRLRSGFRYGRDVLRCMAVGTIGLLAGCHASTAKEALTLRPQSLEWRERTTRRFATKDEGKILAAVAGVLQDFGFTLDNSESDLGLVVASEDRSAVRGSQVAEKVFAYLLFRHRMSIDKNQHVRASIVTRPVRGEIAVRATFQRIVYDDQGRITCLEAVEDHRIYQEFFDRLSQAVFLEAQQM